jgi:hypothetical protein
MMDPDFRDDLRRQAQLQRAREEAQRKAEEGYLLTYTIGGERWQYEEFTHQHEAARRVSELQGKAPDLKVWKRVHISVIPAQVRFSE